jgi:phosphopantothenoylcysteine decarboxylase/phosphopantothenate--cysteine ligase
MSASIAAFKACETISALKQNGAEVQVVVTPDTFQFVGEATLEGLTGRPVLSKIFNSGKMMDHIALTRWADLAVLAPATANTLNRLATGMADDLIGALFLAYPKTKPYLIAPAMNTQMFQHPTVQNSIKKLTDWGVRVLPTEAGHLACGEVGEGRLLSPQNLLKAIETAMGEDPSEPRPRVLITSGGTREPLDNVRFITNASTGRTGVFLANYLHDHGYDVTLIRAKDSQSPNGRVKQREYTRFFELDEALRQELGQQSYRAVIHLAAVGDYYVDTIRYEKSQHLAQGLGKIESDQDLVVHLRRHPKIVDHLREYSVDKSVKVVAFKLTDSASQKDVEVAVNNLFQRKAADLVVHNELSERLAHRDSFQIWSPNESLQPCDSLLSLGCFLTTWIAQENS